MIWTREVWIKGGVEWGIMGWRGGVVHDRGRCREECPWRFSTTPASLHLDGYGILSGGYCTCAAMTTPACHGSCELRLFPNIGRPIPASAHGPRSFRQGEGCRCRLEAPSQNPMAVAPTPNVKEWHVETCPQWYADRGAPNPTIRLGMWKNSCWDL